MKKLVKFFTNHDFDGGDFMLYDNNGNKIYHETSDGYWIKRKYNKNNNRIYYKNSDGYWYKREFDIDNNVIYQEDSIKGLIFDQRSTPESELVYEFEFIDGRSVICSGNLELDVIVNDDNCLHRIETLLKPCDITVGDYIVCVGDKKVKHVLTSKKK